MPVPFVLCSKCRGNLMACDCKWSPAQPPRQLKAWENRKVYMRFIFGTDLYSLDFAYSKGSVFTYAKGVRIIITSKHPNTTVTLYKLDPTQEGMKGADIVAMGFTGCYHKDKFSKEVGRRNALRDLCSQKYLDSGRVPKEMRPLIWQAYFKRNMGPDTPLPHNSTPSAAPLPTPGAIIQAKVVNEEKPDLSALRSNSLALVPVRAQIH